MRECCTDWGGCLTGLAVTLSRDKWRSNPPDTRFSTGGISLPLQWVNMLCFRSITMYAPPHLPLLEMSSIYNLFVVTFLSDMLYTPSVEIDKLFCYSLLV